MADSIGAIQFVYVLGALNKHQFTFSEITRKGVDGVAFAEEGIRGKLATLRAGRDYLSGADADAALATYRGMVKTEVEIFQYNGTSRGNRWLILEVDEIAETRANVDIASGGILGTTGLHWMETAWTVQWLGVS